MPKVSRILDNFLKTNKGRRIFIAIKQDDRSKQGSEGILQDYDEKYVLIRGKDSLMMTAISSIISFELAYDDINLIEIVDNNKKEQL